MEGVVIGPNLLREIRDLTEAGGTTKDGASPNFGKQITYVKTTSGTATGGWYPGVVRTYSSGGHTDHAGAVQVKGANGETLANNTVYLTVRQGPSESGVPRYVATTGGGDECDLLEVDLPAFATAAAVNAAINSALGSLSFTGTVSITCSPNGTATASVTLTRSGGSPVSITGVPVSLEGCSLAIV